jgi:membrane protease YdiL (CAAX protease family)
MISLGRGVVAALLQDGGAGRWTSSFRDHHLQLAVAAALPVWIALGLGVAGPLYLPHGPAAWLAFVLIMPLLEELVFRGMVQSQLLQVLPGARVAGLSAANLLTTLAFAATHLLAQPSVWALGVAVPSLVLGHLRERFGSLWPPVIVHVIYNTGFAVAALALR